MPRQTVGCREKRLDYRATASGLLVTLLLIGACGSKPRAMMLVPETDAGSGGAGPGGTGGTADLPDGAPDTGGAPGGGGSGGSGGRGGGTVDAAAGSGGGGGAPADAAVRDSASGTGGKSDAAPDAPVTRDLGTMGTGGATGGSPGTGGAPGTGGTVGPVAFPLKVSSNGRTLVDQSGNPFRIHGDTAWTASTDLTLQEWRTYLDDRKSRGFNTVLVQMTNPVRYQSGSPAPASRGAGGALPFLKNAAGGTWDGDPAFANDMYARNPAPGNFDAAFSSPNPQYFAWIDSLLSEAGTRGMAVVLTACYLGYDNGAQDGWWRTLNNSANTQAVSFAFGQYLGNRYKGVPNLIWQMGVDMLPPAGSEGEARALKILQGIKAAGDTHLWTGHWRHDYVSTDSAAFAPSMDIEGVYTHGPYPSLGPTYGRSRLGYGKTPARPAVLLETTYENEHAATAADVRSFMWGAQLSATAGVIFGNLPIWDFGPGWPAQLGSVGARDMQRMGALLDGLAWHQLVPSGLAGMKTLVTAGTGTYTTMPNPGDPETGGRDWVVSAASSDRKNLLAYVPHEHSGTITVDLTALSGSVRARWFDPTSGAFTAIGTFASTGTQVFTPPATNNAGAKDWVLLLDIP